MKTTFKNAAGLGFFSFFRGAERILPCESFHAILTPFFSVRAELNTRFKATQAATTLPEFLCAAETRVAAKQRRRNAYLNHVLEFFPDRLPHSKWRSRCQIEGLEQLAKARQSGRGAVLAICHFGPYYLLRFWLRAAGFPAATFIGGPSSKRATLKRAKDRYSPFPETPVAFYQDQLRETARFISAGNPLLMPVDAPTGKQMTLPFCAGWNFQMATGAVRFAIHHQAELIPCSIVDLGGWRFRIKLGRPVPREYLADGADWTLAGQHLLNEMIPEFRACPEQCSPDLTRCLKRDGSPISASQVLRDDSVVGR